jgi:RNA polymerase sigma factor (sigma-70 family)
MRSVVFAWMLHRAWRERALEGWEVPAYTRALRRSRAPARQRANRVDPRHDAPRVVPPDAAAAWRADAALLLAVTHGDADATGRFIDRMACVARILAVLNARHGRRLDDHDLADLAQDTVVLVWRKLGVYNETSSLETWVFGIARLEYMNAVRRKRRAPAPIGGFVPEGQPEPDVDDPALASDVTGERLLAALDELGPRDADVVRRKLIDDETFESIAERESVSPSTVKARYYRALERLQRRFPGGQQDGSR